MPASGKAPRASAASSTGIDDPTGAARAAFPAMRSPVVHVPWEWPRSWQEDDVWTASFVLRQLEALQPRLTAIAQRLGRAREALGSTTRPAAMTVSASCPRSPKPARGVMHRPARAQVAPQHVEEVQALLKAMHAAALQAAALEGLLGQVLQEMDIMGSVYSLPVRAADVIRRDAGGLQARVGTLGTTDAPQDLLAIVTEMQALGACTWEVLHASMPGGRERGEQARH